MPKMLWVCLWASSRLRRLQRGNPLESTYTAQHSSLPTWIQHEASIDNQFDRGVDPDVSCRRTATDSNPQKDPTMKAIWISLALALASPAYAQQTQPQPGGTQHEGPCKEIVQACEQAGFVKGEAKEGLGLWADCIDPIMAGKAQPANSKKPLPSVPAGVVSACKTKHPNFGQGRRKPQ
jgi:hypothetical protein